jgi:hypothetical protein
MHKEYTIATPDQCPMGSWKAESGSMPLKDSYSLAKVRAAKVRFSSHPWMFQSAKGFLEYP